MTYYRLSDLDEECYYIDGDRFIVELSAFLAVTDAPFQQEVVPHPVAGFDPVVVPSHQGRQVGRIFRRMDTRSLDWYLFICEPNPNGDDPHLAVSRPYRVELVADSTPLADENWAVPAPHVVTCTPAQVHAMQSLISMREARNKEIPPAFRIIADAKPLKFAPGGQ